MTNRFVRNQNVIGKKWTELHENIFEEVCVKNVNNEEY